MLMDEWGMLADALRDHPHRLAVALHVAGAAATGGGKLTPDEEHEIVRRFDEILDEGIRRTGGSRSTRLGDHTNAFAEAVWSILISDSHRSPDGLMSARCPAIATMGICPGESGFVATLRRVAPGYVRTAIAGASAAEIAELRELLEAGDTEAYAPFGGPFGAYKRNSRSLASAMATLARRRASNTEICSAVHAYAAGYARLASKHTIPPVARIGLIAWLARAALHEPPPPSHERPTGGVQ